MLLLSRTSGEILDFYTGSGKFLYALEFECHRHEDSASIHEAFIRTTNSVDGEESTIDVDDKLDLGTYFNLSKMCSLRVQPIDSYQPRAQVCLDVSRNIVVIRREILAEVGVDNFDFSRYS